MINKRVTKGRQTGVAGIGILASLMAIAVITTIAVKQSWRNDLDLTRSEFRWLGIQAKGYFEFGEQLAIALFAAKLDNGNTAPPPSNGPKQNSGDVEYKEKDTLEEWWALETPSIPRGPAQISIKAVDAQSKFNLNSLGGAFNRENRDDGNIGGFLPGALKYTPPQRRFIRLLQTIPLDETIESDETGVEEGGQTFLETEEAEQILIAVKDWVDSDSVSSGFDATEQDYYQGLEIPISISNGLMASVTELRQVKGVSPLLYQRILPYVTALSDASAGININTMVDPSKGGREADIYRLIRIINASDTLEPLPLEKVEEVYSELDTGCLAGGEGCESESKGYSKVSQLEENSGLGGVFPPPGDIPNRDERRKPFQPEGLSVTTEYFELHMTLQVGDHVKRGRTLLKRDKKLGAVVVRRTDANF